VVLKGFGSRIPFHSQKWTTQRGLLYMDYMFGFTTLQIETKKYENI
jgi:hypothetical protein